MRVFLGIILGGLLTIAAAYIHDSMMVDRQGASAQAMVNWDVVSREWQGLQTDVRALGDRIHDQLANR